MKYKLHSLQMVKCCHSLPIGFVDCPGPNWVKGLGYYPVFSIFYWFCHWYENSEMVSIFCWDVFFALVANFSAAAISIGGSKVYLLGIVSLCSYDQFV